MASIERLIANYESFITMTWRPHLSDAQRVWFAVYDPVDERRLRARLGAFEAATREAGHGWILCDLTNSFPAWMAAHQYKESYFEDPEYLSSALHGYAEHLKTLVFQCVDDAEADANSVIALTGAGALFGLASVSQLVDAISPNVRGRLLVFFPGAVDGGRYRLFDARAGWNYHAVPITGE